MVFKKMKKLIKIVNLKEARPTIKAMESNYLNTHGIRKHNPDNTKFFKPLTAKLYMAKIARSDISPAVNVLSIRSAKTEKRTRLHYNELYIKSTK